MMTFYFVYSRLRLMNDFIAKYRAKKYRETVEVFKKAAIFNDKVCDALESIKISSAINTVVYCIQGLFFSVLSNYSYISYYSNKNSTLLGLVFCITTSNWCCY